MNSSSSSSILYLDDDDDDRESNQYFQTNSSVSKSSSSNEMSIPCKKRKLSDPKRGIDSSIVNRPKRQRNDHYQAPSSRNFIDSHTDIEPILLDPDEYIIEEPDHQSFCSFDWTIQSQLLPSTSLLPTKIPSSPMQTATKNKTSKPLGNQSNLMPAVSQTNSNDRFTQAKRKPTVAPSLPPPPVSTSSIVRVATQRGRPRKDSRVPRTELPLPPVSTQQQPEQSQSSRPSSSTASSTSSSTSEIRRQALNGTGIFSAFHDTKYYRCNICKFKSVTSATLLQHLFTHMFFCEHCSFYTYSHYNLSQHLLEKHQLNINEDVHDPSNPNTCDLLYVTRCPDGTFALCMDSSLASKTSANDQRVTISTASRNDRQEDQCSKNKPIKPKDKLMEKDNEIVVLAEKRDLSSKRSQTKGKVNQTFISMKHRRCYSLKRSPCLHPLTLEYSICRERTIRHMSHTQEISTKRTFLTRTPQTRLIDEIAHCLRTIVNQIVNDEDLSEQTPLMCTLPDRLLQPVVSMSDLDDLTKSLKLKNKYDQSTEQNDLFNRENSLRQNREHSYILSSPENHFNEQSIISSLHSSLTNGDSIFTQAKINRLPKTLDNTHRYLKGNLNTQPSITNNSNQKVLKITQPPNLIPSRPIVSKPAHPLPNLSVDRNNNSIPSSKSKISSSTTFPSSVIVLD